MTTRSVILGVGSALPRREVTNAELATTVDTSDEWIVERTGIRSRFLAGDGETTASLATDAARRALDLENPRVALLNIGTEEMKGTDKIRDAAAELRAAKHLRLDFKGFIEGNKLSRGEVDVIVCDGFSGNIALKTIEGTARFVADLLKRAFSSSTRSKIGFLISRPATELLRTHLDPNNHNGAVFLGLNGIVVKSHGSANELGVDTAIGFAAKMLRDDLNRRIAEDLGNFEAKAA
jgi:glycerol-3-phosphate acyltransferase PlsX